MRPAWPMPCWRCWRSRTWRAGSVSRDGTGSGNTGLGRRPPSGWWRCYAVTVRPTGPRRRPIPAGWRPRTPRPESRAPDMALPSAIRCHPLRWLLALAALIGAGVLLTPKVSEAASDMPDLRGARIGWLLVALAAETASLLTFSVATYALIEPAARPS